MPYCVYILRRQKDGKYYIGSTSYLEARLHFHNAGSQRSTRTRTTFEVIYTEELVDKNVPSKLKVVIS